MALSDCIQCWQTPCVCGHEYKGWPIKSREELIDAVLTGLSLTDSHYLIKRLLEKNTLAIIEDYEAKLKAEA